MSFLDTTTIANFTNSPYALVILSALSLSESAFFIIPPEVILIPMALAMPNMALIYGIITTIASIVGASLGFFIGRKGGKPVLNKLFSEKKIKQVSILFSKYDTKAIFISAFTPIPFKIFTIAAGVFDLDFNRFLLASLFGRGTRYMLLSALILVFGESIKYFLEHQFDKTVTIGTVVLIIGFGIYKIIIPFIEQKVLKETIKEKFIRIFKYLFHKD